ncbi:MAG: hypothetical protein Q9163_003802 [Psora crenata]
MSDTVPQNDLSGSSNPTKLSEGVTRALNYVQITDSQCPATDPDETARQVLKRRFSTKSTVSTTLSFASAARDGSEQLRIIGLGSCGTIFEIPGTEFVFKKGTSEASLWQDFCLTNKVHNAADKVRTILKDAFPSSTIPKIPVCYEFHPANDKHFWNENIRRRFPADYRTQQPLFKLTRILPLPQQIREALIELYFDDDETIQQEAKDDQKNKDCLVRVYLGERESIRQQSEGYTSLRNFELRLNMMEDLELDISDLAVEMAIGLAIMHWQALVDGMDAEFVLGSSVIWDEESKAFEDESAPPRVINFKRREVHLWMLDFDKASAIEMTEEHVDKKLMPAFLGNDPYYPLPTVDGELWSVFCSAYLKASEIILHAKGVDNKAMTLPQRFLNKVLEQAKKNDEWNAEDQIVFGN